MMRAVSFSVMPALVAGIRVLPSRPPKDVDGRDKPGHDEGDVGQRVARSLLAVFVCAVALGAAPVFANDLPLAERRSGYADMGPQTKAMQDDDSANPAMLWVLDGEALWDAKAGEAQKSCADCHGAADATMKGVAARYPAFDGTQGRPVDLEQRINICRRDHQKATALRFESKDLLALTAFVARQSRGIAITPATDERTKPFLESGRALFHARQGQLNLSCAQCHDDRPGQKLAGVPLVQGQATAYPLYRLEWQALGSLQRRLRNCMIGTRAQPFGYGAPELVDLELYLAWRARGLPMESPGVRP
jgi:sulfur-oxidizing protein SoxA